MANTMTLIASYTVGLGGVGAVDFTSIPSTYTDLCVKWSARTSNGNTFGVNNVYLNGSQTSYTGAKVIEGTGSGVSSYTTATTYGANLDSVGNSSTASTFDSSEIYIPNYAGSNNKSFSLDATGENNATTAYSQLIAGQWGSGSAVNRITFSTSTTSLTGQLTVFLMQYSTFYVYGVKNA
jgi:hypothetical protein